LHHQTSHIPLEQEICPAHFGLCSVQHIADGK
jgi:hypothetical protein